jgi:acyl carrier protein
LERQIVALLEESIQAAPGSVTAAAVLADLNGWDSMGMVTFVGETFDRTQVEVGVDDLQGCVTVADLVALVSRRAAARP